MIEFTKYGEKPPQRFQDTRPRCQGEVIPYPWMKDRRLCLNRAALNIEGKDLCRKHVSQLLMNKLLAGELSCS